MRPNPTDRPTLADLAPMLADAAQEYGTRRHDNGTLNDEETANDLLTSLGDLAEELAISNISVNYLCALMEIVNEYAVTAQTIERQGRANNAAAGLQQVVKFWGLIKDYSPYLWPFANAVQAYDKAQCEANRRRREAEQEAKADEMAELRRRAAVKEMERRAGQIGAVITFTDEDAASTDEPDTDSPTEGAESNEPETTTDNTPKL